MANPRFTETREFGPSLEWEKLPVLGESRSRSLNWPVIFVGLGVVLFWAAVGLAIVLAR